MSYWILSSSSSQEPTEELFSTTASDSPKRGARAFFPREPPVLDGSDHGHQCVTFFGELIRHMTRALAVYHLDDHAIFQQALEAVGEDVGGDALGRGEEVFEATFAEDEVTDDKERPAVTKNVERAGNGAGRAAHWGFGWLASGR